MRLLVVEDEKYLNKTITERLTKLGYCVVDHSQKSGQRNEKNR